MFSNCFQGQLRCRRAKETRQKNKMTTLLCALVAAALVLHANAQVPLSCSCVAGNCFSAVRAAVDFSTALLSCQQKGGRLASSSAHSGLAVTHVLAGVPGQFWTGFKLADENCREPLPTPRTYEWGALELLARNLNTSCSQCLTISTGSMLTERPCLDKLDGYICVHGKESKCGPLPLESTEVVLYDSTDHTEKGLCSIAAGSIAVRLPSKVKYICTPDNDWFQGPWGCEVAKGGCEHDCAVYDSKPKCICPPGKTLESNNLTCADTIDDPCKSLKCEHYCLAQVGCQCHPGYELEEDRKGCKDVDECLDSRVCNNMRCINTIGSFRCMCLPGYEMSNGKCEDIDECFSAPCEHKCVNTPGSYNCSCDDEYIQDPENKQKCVLHCPTKECPTTCQRNCLCPQGYILDERKEGKFCIDIDECETNFCHQLCTNTYGSFSCSCEQGYYLDSNSKCRPINADEGSGFSTTTTASDESPTPTVRFVPGGASMVTPGGMVGIVLCILVIILVLVFLVYRKRWTIKGQGARKNYGEDMKDLQQVAIIEDDGKIFVNKHASQNSC